MGTLQKSLKTRHITMISIGGVIGTGLFVGTGKNILSTGPAAVISYAFACFLIVLIMQMVGEMATGELALGKKEVVLQSLVHLLPMLEDILVHGQGLL